MRAGGDAWKRADASSYDAWAELYDQHMERLATPVAARICKLAGLSSGQTVLDLACGPGIASRAAAAAVSPGGRVLGVDLSEGMVAAAARRVRDDGIADARFAIMDAERLGLPSGRVDAVVCLSAVLHFPDIATVMREIRRVTKPGGRVVVSFGSVRPVRWPALASHVCRRVGERLASAVRPRLRAPDPLIKVASGVVPLRGDTVLTGWSRRRPRRALMAAVRAAGFREVTASWTGHEAVYDDPTDFFLAQAAVSTEVRKRLLAATPAERETIEARAVSQARHVLARGGKLLYAYGACLVSAVAPY